MKKNVTTLTAAALLSTTLVTPALADTYTVKSGDNLSKIAKAHSTTVSKLKEANKLKSDRISVNQKLNIPGNNTYKEETVSIKTAQTKSYTVVSGDTLIKIANKHNITLAELSQWNNLKGHQIYPGQKLVVSKSTNSNTIILPKPKQAAPAPAAVTSYTVKKGDSLWKIANQTGASVQSIKTANNLKSDTVRVGQTLKIPTSKAPITVAKPGTTSVSPSQRVNTVISEAKKQIGVPYSWAGASPSGFDCSGFIYYVYKKAGYQISRLSSSTYYSLGKKVTAPQPGDLVYFNTSSPTNKKVVNHMGIYIGNGQFIHASSSLGVTITPLSNSYWKPKIIGYNRLP
ncbi:LysM peptidoglycan-binding domain-containing protein [Bacillus sp. V59.32b]|uniref:C40 family peptidase n=1 Tax=Bacillus sp. V59.32b TaxID=1758642 RepID=UPI000E3D52B9|nr:peptidoglycan endopeptidase [Bacillus sp. V59.32b]RFU66832.1 peptidoglycan endopeptidase [Bacillus sp. V59.32b]